MHERAQQMVPLVMSWVFLVQLAIIGGWDVYVYFAGHPDMSVTAVVQKWVRDLPIIGVAIGVVLGHLFFPAQRPPSPPSA